MIDGNGVKFNPELSSNADYMADYRDKDYMKSLDGMSKDNTRAVIAEYSAKCPCLRLVDNPQKTVPYAMNNFQL